MLNPTLVIQIQADYAGLVALLASKLHDRTLAEDLINQAFVESLQKLAHGQIADPQRFNGFVYAVAFNLLRNYRRRLGNRPQMRASDASLASLAAEETPAEQHASAITAQQVRRALAALPVPRDRDVIRRLYLEEQSKTVICRELALSPLNFDRIVFRARRRMRKLLEDSGLSRDDFFGGGSPSRPTLAPPAAFAS